MNIWLRSLNLLILLSPCHACFLDSRSKIFKFFHPTIHSQIFIKMSNRRIQFKCCFIWDLQLGRVKCQRKPNINTIGSPLFAIHGENRKEKKRNCCFYMEKLNSFISRLILDRIEYHIADSM